MSPDARFVAAQGVRVPSLGLGTWQMEGDECTRAVADAITIGYRHIDTAPAYGNEREIGEGIRASGVPRDELFVTTKVWRTDLDAEALRVSVDESLERLGYPYIDLLLIHWPSDIVDMSEPLQAMEDLRREGLARHLGVSNFTPTMVARAVTLAPLLAVQVEFHPFLSQDGMLATAEEHDLVLIAYTPLARGRVTTSPPLERIGRKYGKYPAQIALRWLVQQERVAAIPGAANEEHRRENLDIFDFELADDEVSCIAGLDEGLRLVDPSFAPAWERRSERTSA